MIASANQVVAGEVRLVPTGTGVGRLLMITWPSVSMTTHTTRVFTSLNKRPSFSCFRAKRSRLDARRTRRAPFFFTHRIAQLPLGPFEGDGVGHGADGQNERVVADGGGRNHQVHRTDLDGDGLQWRCDSGADETSRGTET